MKSKTTILIANFLEENGHKSPTGKSKWYLLVIQSILSNEKHNGDVWIRKRYVKEHHESIINPEVWKKIQVKLKWHKEL